MRIEAYVLCFALVFHLFHLTWAERYSGFRNSSISRNPTTPNRLSNERLRNLGRLLDRALASMKLNTLTLSLVSPDSHLELLDFISKRLSGNLIASHRLTTSIEEIQETWKRRVDLTWIMLLDHPLLLRDTIHKRDHWKPANRYILIYTHEKSSIDWRTILRDLWTKHKVYKVMILTIQDDFRCLSRFWPFEFYQSHFGKVKRLCLNDDLSLNEAEEESTKSSRSRMFDSFQDLKGYEINVTVFSSLMMNVTYDRFGVSLTGLDADVMRLLEERMKAKFHVKILENMEGRDPFPEALKLLENGQSELIVTNFFAKKYNAYHLYEFTAGIFEDKLCLIAPAAQMVPRSYMPVLPFNKDVWILLGTVNFLMTIFWLGLKHFTRSFIEKEPMIQSLAPDHLSGSIKTQLAPGSAKNHNQHQKRILPLSFKVAKVPEMVFNFSGKVYRSRGKLDTKRLQPTRILGPPELNTHLRAFFNLVILSCYPLQGAITASQKAFLVSTLFFGMIITGLYQSCLVSALSDPWHYPELTSLEDVADSNLTIITKYENLKKDTFLEDTELGRRLNRNIRMVKPSEGHIKDLVAKNRVVALSRYLTVKLESRTEYIDQDGNQLLHIVEEFPASYTLAYVMRAHSPYLERVNSLLLRMQEAGIVGLWYNNLVQPLEAEEEHSKVARSERRIKLTLEHYSLTFAGLFVGLFGCSCMFFVELYLAKRTSP